RSIRLPPSVLVSAFPLSRFLFCSHLPTPQWFTNEYISDWKTRVFPDKKAVQQGDFIRIMKDLKTAFMGAFVLFLASISTSFAQGTAFMYQGQLRDNGGAAQGIYDLRFAIYDSTNNPGTLIAGPYTNNATTISNGLFTVLIDFGPGVFNGSNYWLEVAVRTNGVGGFTALAPRQPVTPTPYSIYSTTAGNATVAASAGSVSGSVSAGQISGTLAASQLP